MKLNISDNLKLVRERMERACQSAGRDPESVKLVAVSKTHAPEVIRQAYEAGQRCFGENYAQELKQKAEALADLPDIEWHLIGHLQRNKIKDILGVATCIQTLDSLRLAQALHEKLQANSQTVDALLQVNVGEEAQKSGMHSAEIPELSSAIHSLGTVKLKGLMAIPPVASGPEASRPHFRQLRTLAEKHQLAELSMGMSHDFEIAIEEGATIVRIGTAIFGPR